MSEYMSGIVLMENGSVLFASPSVYVLDLDTLADLDPETGTEDPADYLAQALRAAPQDGVSLPAVLHAAHRLDVADSDLRGAVELMDTLAEKLTA